MYYCIVFKGKDDVAVFGGKSAVEAFTNAWTEYHGKDVSYRIHQ